MNNLDLNKEFTFRTSKSSGAGGQHVNKVETRVELLFDVNASQILGGVEKNLIWQNLANRINGEGILLLANDSERSQLRNKKLVIKRFNQLIQIALTPKPKRRLTKVPRSVHAKRLTNKKQTSEKKATRKKVKLSGNQEFDLS
ncbi:MAG: ribosome-associated protein [Cognaticolwellia sp.]|jgi:ribosome-associated protein|tara:strand:- start:1735 stop:2163 length:429 start_codon:yes stop_codon:yes gene_type:complete